MLDILKRYSEDSVVEVRLWGGVISPGVQHCWSRGVRQVSPGQLLAMKRETMSGILLCAGTQPPSGSPGCPSSAVRCHPAARAVSLSPQVAETCQLAVRRLEWLQENKQEPGASPYLSVDPAPPAEETDVAKLRKTLLDESCTLFDRYRAMFALRNLGGQAAVLALADGKGQREAASSLLAVSPYRLIRDRPFANPGLPELRGSS